MKQLGALLFIVGLLFGVPPILSAQKTSTVDVHGPTIVAFFPPTTDAELENDADTNEALADFQFYAGSVRKRLQKRGIEFQEVYADRFLIRIGKTTTQFKPSKVDVGYYVIAPGKKPRIEYGVMTDTDLLRVADEYFGQAPSSSFQREPTESCKILLDVLRVLDKVRPGDTREKLEVDFEQDGGIQFGAKTRYMFKKCHLVKVDVEFSGERINQRSEFLLTNKIVRVSKPYIEAPFRD